jgi:hypothetical protein
MSRSSEAIAIMREIRINTMRSILQDVKPSSREEAIQVIVSSLHCATEKQIQRITYDVDAVFMSDAMEEYRFPRSKAVTVIKDLFKRIHVQSIAPKRKRSSMIFPESEKEKLRSRYMLGRYDSSIGIYKHSLDGASSEAKPISPSVFTTPIMSF